MLSPSHCLPCSDYLSDGDVSYNNVSHDEVSHDDFSFSHDEASHDDDAAHYEALFDGSAASFPYDPNSPRYSVMQSTGDPGNPEVGRHLVRGIKKSMTPWF
jgi:hypothetical protein